MFKLLLSWSFAASGCHGALQLFLLDTNELQQLLDCYNTCTKNRQTYRTHVFLHAGLFRYYCTSNHLPKAEYVMSWHVCENIITSASILTVSRHIWMELPQRLTYKLFKKTLQTGSQCLSIPWGNLPVKMFTGYSTGLMCFSTDSFFLQITQIHLNPSEWFSSHFDFITLVSYFQISTDFMYSAHVCHNPSVFYTHNTLWRRILKVGSKRNRNNN